MSEINEIGARLRELREVSEYTVEQVAAELGLEPELYRSYEEDGKDIPISVIFGVANMFGVDFTEIVTGSPARLDTYHIVKRGDGKVVNRNPEYHFEDLAYRYADKIMQPLLVTLEPTDTPAKLITHSGQEFNMVLEGTVILCIGDKEFSLTAGDSIYFNPAIPHGQRCGGTEKARFLTMIAE
ncbi:helix-turn-helix domain-containing protein [Neglectibacter caecimuris]|uniref:helix-turn-helix domain-containing protein n=1 Tax=Neglectibacter caecimuris TaxID=3093658 RepID=UPI002AC8D1E2|nr:cupin domain-containing protein [Neglectibacter sp. M00184]